MKVWLLVVSRDFQIDGEYFSVDVKPHMDAHEIKKNIKDICNDLAEFPDPKLAIWKTVGEGPFNDSDLLQDALNRNPNDIIKKIDPRTKVADLKLSDDDILVLQILSGTSRISTAPEAFSDNFETYS